MQHDPIGVGENGSEHDHLKQHKAEQTRIHIAERSSRAAKQPDQQNMHGRMVGCEVKISQVLQDLRP